MSLKNEFHKARSETPFTTGSRENSQTAWRMRICIAYGIKDVRDALTVDDELFHQLLQNQLTIEQYHVAINETLEEADPQEIKKFLAQNARLAQYLPENIPLTLGSTSDEVVYSKIKK